MVLVVTNMKKKLSNSSPLIVHYSFKFINLSSALSFLGNVAKPEKNVFLLIDLLTQTQHNK